MTYEKLGIDPVTIAIGVTVAAKLVDYWSKRRTELEAQKIAARTEAEKARIQVQIDEAQRMIDYYMDLTEKEKSKQTGIKVNTALAVGIPALLGVVLLTQ